jgi:high-affinity K+ transport system ATPase subunit B
MSDKPKTRPLFDPPIVRQAIGASFKKLSQPEYGAKYSAVSAATLKKGDVVLVEAGDFIPGDGEVVEGRLLSSEDGIYPAYDAAKLSDHIGLLVTSLALTL